MPWRAKASFQIVSRTVWPQPTESLFYACMQQVSQECSMNLHIALALSLDYIKIYFLLSLQAQLCKTENQKVVI